MEQKRKVSPRILEYPQLEKYVAIECNCKSCTSMCKKNSCWPTPEEAKELLRLGYGNKMMRNYFVTRNPGEEDIYAIVPAVIGHEGKKFQDWFGGTCTLYKDGLCTLHDKGLKPSHGKFASCKTSQPYLFEDIAKTWANPEAQQLVKWWTRKFSTGKR